MEYRVYCERALEGSKLVDAGEFQSAMQIFQELMNSDISDIDKSLMAHNIAVICEKMGQVDAALAWYDHGIAYESPYFRSFVMKRKASYLAQIWRWEESIALYEEMQKQPFATEEDKERCRDAVSVLKRPRT